MARVQRLDPLSSAARVRTVPCIARAPSRAKKNTPARKEPSISLAGSWLRAAGFASGKPCFVRAFARRQIVIYQPD